MAALHRWTYGNWLFWQSCAARFDVEISTTIGWVNRYRETGSFAPGRMGAVG